MYIINSIYKNINYIILNESERNRVRDINWIDLTQGTGGRL